MSLGSHDHLAVSLAPPRLYFTGLKTPCALVSMPTAEPCRKGPDAQNPVPLPSGRQPGPLPAGTHLRQSPPSIDRSAAVEQAPLVRLSGTTPASLMVDRRWRGDKHVERAEPGSPTLPVGNRVHFLQCLPKAPSVCPEGCDFARRFRSRPSRSSCSYGCENGPRGGRPAD